MMGRRMRLALFTVVALVQLAVAGGAIVRSELALRTGEPRPLCGDPLCDRSGAGGRRS